MTLTRAAYKFTIQNVTQGWTKSMTAGDVPVVADGVWVIDPLTISWGADSDLLPGTLEPDTATFTITAKTAPKLPRVNIGDIVLVNLDRPATPTAIPYTHFAGRVRQANLEQVPGKGVTIQVTCSDFIADLSSKILTGDPGFSTADSISTRIKKIAAAAGLNVITNLLTDNGTRLNPARPSPDADAGAVLNQTLAGETGYGTSAAATWVLRASYKPATPLPGAGDPSNPPTVTINDPDSDVYYFAQPVFPVPVIPGHLPFTAKIMGGKLTADYNDPLAQTAMIVLDASKIPVGSDRTKSRDAAINQAAVQVWHETNDGGDPLIAQYADLVKLMGPNPRTVETIISNVVGISSTYWLPDRASVTAWSFPDLSIPVLDQTFSDAELDHYAPMFYPAPVLPFADLDPIVGRPLAILRVASDVNVDGLVISGRVVGGSFTVAGGQLTITPTVRNFRPDYRDSIYGGSSYVAASWSELATATPTATWTNVDPTLRWDDFAFIDA